MVLGTAIRVFIARRWPWLLKPRRLQLRKSNASIRLRRLYFTNNSTIGELRMDNKFECWILEPALNVVHGAIPFGTYEVTLYDSPKNHCMVPLLKEVPGREMIEIHTGNFPHDSNGCLLPGQMRGVDYVGQSELAFLALMPKIEAKLKDGPLWIDISDGVS